LAANQFADQPVGAPADSVKLLSLFNAVGGRRVNHGCVYPLTSMVGGTTLIVWEMKPPMPVGCAGYRWADILGLEIAVSGFADCASETVAALQR
jgi:hypothetical protein